MTIEEYNKLLQLARDRKNWTPELFKQYQAASHAVEPFMIRGYHITCIFDDLRQVLSKEDYKDFDLAYCEYIRSGQKGVVKYIEQLHRREAAEQWEQKKKELLQKKRQLLIKKSKLLTGS